MADETRTLAFGTTYDMAAVRNACGQFLSLTEHRPNDEFPPHRHCNDYLCMVLKGGFAEKTGNMEREMRAGQFLVHQAGETHHDRIGSRGAVCLNIHFAPGQAPPVAHQGACSVAGKIAAQRLAFELMAGAGDELVSTSLTAEIMAEVRPGGAKRSADEGGWLTTLVEAICDEPSKRWRLGELARIAGRHPVHVAQAFRARTGLSLGAFQRMRRLTALSLALRRSDSSLAMLASDFGYSDQAHMTGEFGRAVGTTPDKYRRRP